MELIKDTWTKFIDYLRTNLEDPLSRDASAPWIYSSFPGSGFAFTKPTIVVTQVGAGPAPAPYGIGNTKRYYDVVFEIYILTSSERHQIDSTYYVGPELREYYTTKIINLITDNLETTANYLEATDIHLSATLTLPYFEDLDEWRKMLTIIVETFKQ